VRRPGKRLDDGTQYIVTEKVKVKETIKPGRRRLIAVTEWLGERAEARGLQLGYFGASTGAAAALVAVAVRPKTVAAIVSRGGRPDLAGRALALVRAPTLLIVGGEDDVVIELNHRALAELRVEAELMIVPGATHLFEEPGALDQVAHMALKWFEAHLAAARTHGVA
jgi:dipeptidyl aminopeptidase/acylaminoacyl peptidase